MNQSNVTTSHLLTDMQDIWLLPRGRGSNSLSLQRFWKTQKNVETWKQFHGRQKVGGSSEISTRLLSSGLE